MLSKAIPVVIYVHFPGLQRCIRHQILQMGGKATGSDLFSVVKGALAEATNIALVSYLDCAFQHQWKVVLVTIQEVKVLMYKGTRNAWSTLRRNKDIVNA